MPTGNTIHRSWVSTNGWRAPDVTPVSVEPRSTLWVDLTYSELASAGLGHPRREHIFSSIRILHTICEYRRSSEDVLPRDPRFVVLETIFIHLSGNAMLDLIIFILPHVRIAVRIPAHTLNNPSVRPSKRQWKPQNVSSEYACSRNCDILGTGFLSFSVVFDDRSRVRSLARIDRVWLTRHAPEGPVKHTDRFHKKPRRMPHLGQTDRHESQFRVCHSSEYVTHGFTMRNATDHLFLWRVPPALEKDCCPDEHTASEYKNWIAGE